MTLEEFVTAINQQKDVTVSKAGPDTAAKALAQVFVKNKDEDIDLLEAGINEKSSDNEILFIKIKRNVMKNKQYKFLQADNLYADIDAFNPYLDSENKILNQKWHVLISLLAVLDISSFDEDCKNDNRFSTYNIGKITEIKFEEALLISHEKRVNGRTVKRYPSSGMVEFIKKALDNYHK